MIKKEVSNSRVNSQPIRTIRQLMNGMADLLCELAHKGHPERENDLLQVL